MTPTAVLAITFADGSIGIMQYFGEDTSEKRLQAEIDKGSWHSEPVAWRRSRLNELPSNREFRDAWVDTGKAIEPELGRAKAIVEKLATTDAQRLQIAAATSLAALRTIKETLDVKVALGPSRR